MEKMGNCPDDVWKQVVWGERVADLVNETYSSSSSDAIDIALQCLNEVWFVEGDDHGETMMVEWNEKFMQRYGCLSTFWKTSYVKLLGLGGFIKKRWWIFYALEKDFSIKDVLTEFISCNVLCSFMLLGKTFCKRCTYWICFMQLMYCVLCMEYGVWCMKYEVQHCWQSRVDALV